MATAFRLVHTNDLRARIEAERLDAAQQEFDRQERVRLATVQVLAGAARELQALANQPFALSPEQLRTVASTVDGVLEVLRGEWILSPRTMATKRALEAHRT
jgi:hypothetical protein